MTVKESRWTDDLGTSLDFWKMSGLFTGGHTTYAPGQLVKEGPFTNPARMIEDIMGNDPGPELLDGRSESEFWAAVWAHAGWWDQKKGVMNHDTLRERREEILQERWRRP
jgi:hypothetical protein